MKEYDYAVIGTFHGLDVIETPNLHWTSIIKVGQKVFVGETQHLLHQIAKARVRIAMRADLEKTLDAFAERVGVDRSTMSR